MFSQLSERQIHVVRWILTIAWLAIIASLFYDPWTPGLTAPNHPWSPLRLTDTCISVQGKCLVEQPYPLATTLFWGAIVPGSIFILLVLGHEVWRRICPLSFLSQIPRALGWQRQFKRENTTTGKVRYELAKVKSESWLGRNYPYLQFSWLFIGLCGRILFFNADRTILALWLLLTIGSAITVGYLYSGKSWCNYFCPMAPVQRIYSEPGGLLTSNAHTSERSITQSMCRTILPDGSEQSACVACQNPCIDIDSERSYWDGLNKPETAFLRYSYVGLVVGYFSYYYLYAGSWDYYISGAWAREPNQLSLLLSPGLYLFGQTINIPKLVAVPLILGVFTAVGDRLGKWIENRVRFYSRNRVKLTSETIKHRIFTLFTFTIFNFFFIFGGRPLVQLMPISIQFIYEMSLVLLSTLWVYKTWHRSFDLYSRENLVTRFRKQLEKLQLNISQFFDGRTLSDLNTHEVYILAKVLPGFTREKRHTAYKGVVREALEEGYANYSSSLEILQQLRHELGITADEHRAVLEELGIEDPELLNPDLKRSLENQIRLVGYRKSLERLMLLQKRQGNNNMDSSIVGGKPAPLVNRDSPEIIALRRQYSIAPQEEDWILGGISPEAGNLRRAEFLLAQLPDAILCYRALHQSILQEHRTILMLLWNSISHKKELIVRTILEIIEPIQNDLAAIEIAKKLGELAPAILTDILESNRWTDRLNPGILKRLTSLEGQSMSCPLDYPSSETLKYLNLLLDDRNPVIQSACLYIIAQLNLDHARSIAPNYSKTSDSPLLQTTAKIIQSAIDDRLPLITFPLLEKVAYLFNSDFFNRLNSETLIVLADRAEVRTFATNGVITEAGDTCRELLLLIEGAASIHFNLENEEVQIEKIPPGQILDELEIMVHGDSKNTVIADSDGTRILAVPVDAFDDLLERDADLSQRVLELESHHIQRFMGSLKTS